MLAHPSTAFQSLPDGSRGGQHLSTDTSTSTNPPTTTTFPPPPPPTHQQIGYQKSHVLIQNRRQNSKNIGVIRCQNGLVSMGVSTSTTSTTGAVCPLALNCSASNRGPPKISGQEEEYASDILEWLIAVETRTLPIPEYMQNQPHLTWRMRKTLILWLVQVSQEFQLVQDSLYLAINFIDRISSKRTILAGQYQLVGLASLWLAAKMCENHGRVPNIKKLMHICCQTYTWDNFCVMERFILLELGFYLCHVSSEEVVNSLSFLHGHNLLLLPTTVSVARYIIEYSLIHKRFVGVRPSLIARAALNLACNIVQGHDIQDMYLTEYDLICQSHLRDCISQPVAIINKKFDCAEYHYATRICEKVILGSYFDQVKSNSANYQVYGGHPSNSSIKTNNGLLTPPKEPDEPVQTSANQGLSFDFQNTFGLDHQQVLSYLGISLDNSNNNNNSSSFHHRW